MSTRPVSRAIVALVVVVSLAAIAAMLSLPDEAKIVDVVYGRF
jgi:hypothetical protein